MKININYDLMTKIAEANNGFVLKKTVKRILIYSAISITIAQVIVPGEASLSEELLKGIVTVVPIHTLGAAATDLTLIESKKRLALNKLKALSLALNQLNLNTDSELLLKSQKYKTEYNFNHNDSTTPKLEERKYIMIPVYENGEEKEVSVLQEHIIGTKTYSLSLGSPKKVVKLSFNPA